MISYSLGCIFIHIPKNAGTSMEQYLMDITFGKEDPTFNPYVGGAYTHYTLSQIRDELKSGGAKTRAGAVRTGCNPQYPSSSEGIYDKFFKFAIVRNPWERMISLYEYCVAGGRENELWVGCDFRTFCHKFKENRLLVHSAHSYKGEIYKEHLRKQHEFIDRDIDFVLRYENLSKDFKRVADHLGLSVPFLPKTNSSKRRPREEYYDNLTKDLVREIFVEDIRVFSYHF